MIVFFLFLLNKLAIHTRTMNYSVLGTGMIAWTSAVYTFVWAKTAYKEKGFPLNCINLRHLGINGKYSLIG